jgi:hypothetical protein
VASILVFDEQLNKKVLFFSAATQASHVLHMFMLALQLMLEYV